MANIHRCHFKAHRRIRSDDVYQCTTCGAWYGRREARWIYFGGLSGRIYKFDGVYAK